MSDAGDGKDAPGTPTTFQRRWGRLRQLPWDAVAVAFVGIVLAAALRYTLLDFKSVDYYSSLKPWYAAIKAQGFSAFGTAFSNYNPPYLYLLYLVVRLFPDAPAVVAAKISSGGS